MEEPSRKTYGQLREPLKLTLDEVHTFYICRFDANTVLVRGLPGYDAKKDKPNQIRKAQGITWDLACSRQSGAGTGRSPKEINLESVVMASDLQKPMGIATGFTLPLAINHQKKVDSADTMLR